MGLRGFGGVRTINRRAPCMADLHTQQLEPPTCAIWLHMIFYTLNPFPDPKLNHRHTSGFISMHSAFTNESSQRGLFSKYASSSSSFPLVAQGLRATFCLTHQKGGKGRNNIDTSLKILDTSPLFKTSAILAGCFGLILSPKSRSKVHWFHKAFLLILFQVWYITRPLQFNSLFFITCDRFHIITYYWFRGSIYVSLRP